VRQFEKLAFGHAAIVRDPTLCQPRPYRKMMARLVPLSRPSRRPAPAAELDVLGAGLALLLFLSLLLG